MIKLTNLQKIYRTKEIETVALENVNLEVQQGEFLSIMGPSGCGKSTLLNIMGLLDLPTSGTVEINGVNTVGMSDKELARFLAEVEYRRSAAGGGAIWKGMAHALEWLQQPPEEG